MSGGWPSPLALCNATDYGTVVSGSIGTAITSPSTVNTKSAYTQLVAATSTDADWLMVSISPPGSAFCTMAIDIAIGPSGSEFVIVPNLISWQKNNTSGAQGGNEMYLFPCCIPAGTRIAARCQCSSASQTGHVQVTTFQSNFAGAAGGIVDAIGFSSSTTTGTEPTPGTNAQGSYAQLIASTAADYRGFCLGFDFGNSSSGSAFYSHLLNVAIGPSGSERVILPNLNIALWCAVNNIITPGNSPYFPIPIASGTRIAVSDAVSASGGPNIGVTLYGVRA